MSFIKTDVIRLLLKTEANRENSWSQNCLHQVKGVIEFFVMSISANSVRSDRSKSELPLSDLVGIE